MKKLVIASVLAVSFAFAGSLTAGGEATFKTKGCTACHHATKDQLAMGLGPSLKQIAAAYKGDKAGLVSFLQGKGKARVAPEKYAIMQGQLAMLAGMNKGQLTSLATYILKH